MTYSFLCVGLMYGELAVRRTVTRRIKLEVNCEKDDWMNGILLLGTAKDNKGALDEYVHPASHESGHLGLAGVWSVGAISLRVV